MRRFVSLFTAMLFFMSAFADEAVRVWTSESEYVSFDLENDDAMVSLDSDQSLVVITSKSVVIFPKNTFKKITFDGVKEKDNPDVDAVKNVANTCQAILKVSNSRIFIQGTTPKEAIRIYDVNGHLCEAGSADDNGNWTSGVLTPKLYIVNGKNISFKVQIK